MKNFFKGISFSQLFAGALAAVTSFLLSSKIGIAGSVIGAGVASIVSSAASQIYKNVLDASSEKLQATQAQLGLRPADGAEDGDGEDDEASSGSESTQRIPTVDADGAAGEADGRETRAPRTVSSTHGVRGGGPVMNTRDKRVAIVIAVVSALVAVGVTAGIILALTDGKGTDSVVRDIVHPTVTQSPDLDHGDDRIVTPRPDATVTVPAPSSDATVVTPAPDPSSSTSSGATTNGGTNGTTTDGGADDSGQSGDAGQQSGATTDGGANGTDSGQSGDAGQGDQNGSTGSGQSKDSGSDAGTQGAR